MWLIYLEALLALLLFVFIIWWTMFHGRGGDDASEPHRKDGSDI